MRRKLFIVVVSVFLFVALSHAVFAVSWLPLVPCGTSANPTPCNQCDLLKLLKNIIDFVLIGLMPPVAAILFVWGGFLILMGGANTNWVAEGKKIFFNTAVGIAIISGSWLITNTIIKSVANESITNPNTPWYQFECKVTTYTPTTTTETPTQTTTGTTTCSNNKVSPSMDSSTNLCQPRKMPCTYSSCSSYNQTIQKYAGGAASANLLKAIMVKESSCNASADSGHDYGLMQLLPSTAVIYANRCGITNAKQIITPQWLKANPTLSICLAAEYLRAISQTACGSSIRNIAAGYNGGPGACDKSADCAGNSCDGSPVKRWECVYDNPEHTICNNTRPKNFDETRDYATAVLYCYNNPGF